MQTRAYAVVAALVLFSSLAIAADRRVEVTDQAASNAVARASASFSTPGEPNFISSLPQPPASPVDFFSPGPPLSASGGSVFSLEGKKSEVSGECLAATKRLKGKVNYYVRQNRKGRYYGETKIAALVYSLVYTEDGCKKQGVKDYLNLGCGIYLEGFTKTVDSQLNCATNTLYNWLERRACSGNAVCALQKYSPETLRPDGSFENRPGLYSDRLAIARTVVADGLYA